jgi:hypothetical protein
VGARRAAVKVRLTRRFAGAAAACFSMVTVRRLAASAGEEMNATATADNASVCKTRFKLVRIGKGDLEDI